MKLPRILFTIFIVIVYIYMLAPVMVVIITSINPSSLNSFPPQGFSLRWYKEFFQNPTFMHAFFNISLKIAIIVSIASTVLGFMASIAISRYKFRGATLVETFLLSPMMMPHMLVGISLLLFLSKIIFIGNIFRLIIGHMIICIPIAIRTIYASLSGLNRTIEEAARTLGANPLQTFFWVTMRLTFSGILASMIFSFIISFTDVNVSLFFTGPGITTIPIEIFLFLQFDSSPVVSAITSVQVFMIIIFSYALNKLVGLSSIMKY